MKRVLFTLIIEGFPTSITDLTMPLIQRYAEKIRADIQVISERKFPGWPPVYEKLQIHELGRDNDWNIFFDADTLIHPDMYDVSNHVPRDTVVFNGKDMASNRWVYDQYFWRDARNIGACTWNVWCSNWTLDLWKPLEDLTLEEAVKRIYPVFAESQGDAAKTSASLIDDYTLSRNIARFGLKHTTIMALNNGLYGPGTTGYFWHAYGIPTEQKVVQMEQVLVNWGLLKKPVIMDMKGSGLLPGVIPITTGKRTEVSTCAP